MAELISIERSIGIYDEKSEKLIKEIPINITIDEIKTIVTAEEDDPLYYGAYLLTETQLIKLIKFCSEKFEIDFALSYYFLECYGIYDYMIDKSEE